MEGILATRQAVHVCEYVLCPIEASQFKNSTIQILKNFVSTIISNKWYIRYGRIHYPIFQFQSSHCTFEFVSNFQFKNISFGHQWTLDSGLWSLNFLSPFLPSVVMGSCLPVPPFSAHSYRLVC